MAIWLIALFIGPDVIQSVSLGQRLVRIGVTVLLAVVCDFWFARRMGLSLDDAGIVCHGAFRDRRIPWEDVQDFEWRRLYDRRAE